MESDPRMTYVILLVIGMTIGYFGAFLVRAIAGDDNSAKKKGTVLLSRSKESRLVVEVDGKEIIAVADLNDEQYVRVQNMTLDFEKWAGRSPALSPSTEKALRPAESPASPSISLPPPILFTSGGVNPPAASTSV